MEGDKDITTTLKDSSLRMQSIKAELDSLSERASAKQTAIQEEAKKFEAELKRLKAGVKNQNLSVGDATKDYVLVNYPFYAHEIFSDEFSEYTKSLRSVLGKLSDARRFWHHRNEPQFWAENKDVYDVLFLGEKPYVISPTEIRLQSKSSRIITLETVFLDKEARWPFVKEVNEGKELVVAPRGANHDYTTPELTKEQCDINRLEKILGNNPLALVAFRKAFGLDVVPDLQEIANQYVHEVALKAFKAIREGYRSVKSNDRSIMEIEARYNSPQRETGMFATRPVIIDPEPDPVLAAMISYDARTDRDRALKGLAICVNDLNRTGLANCNLPLEETVGAGQKLVSNLAEFGNYVKGILELSCKTRENVTV